MPIITKAGSPVKGSPTQFTLDKAELAAVTSVAADSYFSDSSNWKEVVLFYKSSTGKQKEIVKFDASLASPTANFAVSLKAKDVFNIHKIVIKDFDGGTFEVPRSALTTAEFDVDMASAPISALITGDFTGGSVPSGWSYVTNPAMFATAGYAHFELYDQLGNKLGSSVLQPSTSYNVRVHVVSATGSPSMTVYIGGSLNSVTSSQITSNVGTYFELTVTTSNSIGNNWEILINNNAGTFDISKVEIFAV